MKFINVFLLTLLVQARVSLAADSISFIRVGNAFVSDDSSPQTLIVVTKDVSGIFVSTSKEVLSPQKLDLKKLGSDSTASIFIRFDQQRPIEIVSTGVSRALSIKGSFSIELDLTKDIITYDANLNYFSISHKNKASKKTAVLGFIGNYPLLNVSGQRMAEQVMADEYAAMLRRYHLNDGKVWLNGIPVNQVGAQVESFAQKCESQSVEIIPSKIMSKLKKLTREKDQLNLISVTLRQQLPVKRQLARSVPIRRLNGDSVLVDPETSLIYRLSPLSVDGERVVCRLTELN